LRKDANRSALREVMGLQAVKGVPVAGLVTRFAHQKGLDLLLSALAQWTGAGGQVALGMVALKPWRAHATEAALAAGASPAEAIARELEGASPLGRNDFKLPLVARLSAAAIYEANGRGA
jgi:CO/xanthine dehydrogenase FAD-binding subunit